MSTSCCQSFGLPRVYTFLKTPCSIQYILYIVYRTIGADNFYFYDNTNSYHGAAMNALKLPDFCSRPWSCLASSLPLAVISWHGIPLVLLPNVHNGHIPLIPLKTPWDSIPLVFLPNVHDGNIPRIPLTTPWDSVQHVLLPIVHDGHIPRIPLKTPYLAISLIKWLMA